MIERQHRVLFLAVSEGGPPIVHSILSQLPAGFPVPIVISQVFRSGPIDPICNALSRTTRLRVHSTTGDVALEMGEALVLPYGTVSSFKVLEGNLFVAVRNNEDVGPGNDACSSSLIESGRFFGEGIQVAFAGLIGKHLMRLRDGIESVLDSGGGVLFVKEARAIISPEVKEYIDSESRVDVLSPDEIVVRVCSWAGTRARVRPST